MYTKKSSVRNWEGVVSFFGFTLLIVYVGIAFGWNLSYGYYFNGFFWFP